MMDIQSPTCFGPTTSLPRNSSANSLSRTVHNSANRTDPTQNFNFKRNLSYTENMVVETQALNFGPMTPDPHPDNVDKSETQTLNLKRSRPQSISLPPEGAMTPNQEPLAKRSRLHTTDIHSSDKSDYSETPPISNFPVSPSDMQTEEKTDFHANVNGVTYTDKQSKDILNSDDGLSQDSFKDNKETDLFGVKGSQSLFAAFKMGLDKSPPTLSPKTMSDTDIDAVSTGSPSVSISGERRKRKPKIEDIVRRMKDVETDYYSEDSDDEKMIPEDDVDEVDGDVHVKMPVLATQSPDIKGEKPVLDNKGNQDTFPKKYDLNSLNENNNIIDKLKTENGIDETSELKTDNGDTKDHDTNHKGIPLPATSSVSETIGPNGEPVFKTANQSTPPKMNGSQWLHGAFGNFPMFPFQASPPDLQFQNILSPFENRYAGPELEKDYLKCQFCERTFRRQKNLENHIENTHHGKSPVRKKPGENGGEMYFKCTHCPYTTKHQSNLYVHLRIHTGLSFYVIICFVCLCFSFKLCLSLSLSLPLFLSLCLCLSLSLSFSLSLCLCLSVSPSLSVCLSLSLFLSLSLSVCLSLCLSLSFLSLLSLSLSLSFSLSCLNSAVKYCWKRMKWAFFSHYFIPSQRQISLHGPLFTCSL